MPKMMKPANFTAPGDVHRAWDRYAGDTTVANSVRKRTLTPREAQLTACGSRGERHICGSEQTHINLVPCKELTRGSVRYVLSIYEG